MNLTWRPSLITQALVDLLEINKASIGLQQVFYGHDAIVSATPAVTIGADNLTRQLYQTGHTFKVESMFDIVVYYSSFGNNEFNTKQCDEFAESVVGLLEVDLTLGGLLVTGYVLGIDPAGTSTSGTSIMKAGRLQYKAISQGRLGQ